MWRGYREVSQSSTHTHLHNSLRGFTPLLAHFTDGALRCHGWDTDLGSRILDPPAFSPDSLSGFPKWLSGKESACQFRRHRKRRFNPWVGKTPWKSKWPAHSSLFAWKISWTEEPDRLQFMGSQRVGHNLATKPYVCISESTLLYARNEYNIVNQLLQ